MQARRIWRVRACPSGEAAAKPKSGGQIVGAFGDFIPIVDDAGPAFGTSALRCSTWDVNMVSEMVALLMLQGASLGRV